MWHLSGDLSEVKKQVVDKRKSFSGKGLACAKVLSGQVWGEVFWGRNSKNVSRSQRGKDGYQKVSAKSGREETVVEILDFLLREFRGDWRGIGVESLLFNVWTEGKLLVEVTVKNGESWDKGNIAGLLGVLEDAVVSLRCPSTWLYDFSPAAPGTDEESVADRLSILQGRWYNLKMRSYNNK